MILQNLKCLFDNRKLVRIGLKNNLYKLKVIRKPFLISLAKPLKC